MANNNTTTIPKVPISKGKNSGKLQDRPDRGRLPGHVPEPAFVADPNHRRKKLTGELYLLATAKVSEKKTMTRMDSSRIGKNFGYMVRALPNMPESQYVDAAKAVIEHHFDDHRYCGDWCRRKSMTPLQITQSKRYYRDKKKESDAMLYDVLSNKLSRFITFDRIKEVAHGMDSQVNESLNNTVSWFAPKNKVYCGSLSLSNRIGLALGINALGHKDYFVRLFKLFGISMMSNISHFLQVKDKTRSSRLFSLKTRERKKDRNKVKYSKLVEETAIAVKERSKRDGTYRTGQNMDEGGVYGYTAEDLQEPVRKKAKNRADVVCKCCKKRGHSTARSKDCLFYKARGPRCPVAVAPRTAEDDASDISDWDAMPLESEVSDADLFNDASAACFIDAFAQSDGDDSVGITRAPI
jgi:hypothetical protein